MQLTFRRKKRKFETVPFHCKTSCCCCNYCLILFIIIDEFEAVAQFSFPFFKLLFSLTMQSLDFISDRKSIYHLNCKVSIAIYR